MLTRHCESLLLVRYIHEVFLCDDFADKSYPNVTFLGGLRVQPEGSVLCVDHEDVSPLTSLVEDILVTCVVAGDQVAEGDHLACGWCYFIWLLDLQRAWVFVEDEEAFWKTSSLQKLQFSDMLKEPSLIELDVHSINLRFFCYRRLLCWILLQTIVLILWAIDKIFSGAWVLDELTSVVNVYSLLGWRCIHQQPGRRWSIMWSVKQLAAWTINLSTNARLPWCIVRWYITGLCDSRGCKTYRMWQTMKLILRDLMIALFSLWDICTFCWFWLFGHFFWKHFFWKLFLKIFLGI